jgi:hypothetical protein
MTEDIQPARTRAKLRKDIVSRDTRTLHDWSTAEDLLIADNSGRAVQTNLPRQ